MELNLWAVLVAAIAYVAVGVFWYSRALFAESWMKLVGFTEEDTQREYTPWMMVANTVVALVGAFVLALIVDWMNATNILQGLFVGALVGVGVSAATRLPEYMYEGRPFRLFLINSGHDIVGFLLMGAILGLWQ